MTSVSRLSMRRATSTNSSRAFEHSSLARSISRVTAAGHHDGRKALLRLPTARDGPEQTHGGFDRGGRPRLVGPLDAHRIARRMAAAERLPRCAGWSEKVEARRQRAGKSK